MALVQHSSLLDIVHPGHTEFVKLCKNILNMLEGELRIKGLSCQIKDLDGAWSAEIARSGERFVRLHHPQDQDWIAIYDANGHCDESGSNIYRISDFGRPRINRRVISYLVGVLYRYRELNDELLKKAEAFTAV